MPAYVFYRFQNKRAMDKIVAENKTNSSNKKLTKGGQKWAIFVCRHKA